MPNVVFPPRPKNRLIPGQLAQYEQTGKWVCQRKFNGARNTVHISADRKVSLFHYGEPHKAWKPTAAIAEQILTLDLEAGLEYWLDSELLNGQTSDPHYKNRIVLYDVLASGRYLLGTDQMARIALLEKFCRRPEKLESKHGIAKVVTENVWMAETWDRDFLKIFRQFLHLDQIEGLVLRKKKSVLDFTGTKRYEVPWQIRCRKPKEGTYDF